MRKRRSLVVLVGAAVVVGAFLGFLLRSSDDSAAPKLHGARLSLMPAARRRQLPDLRGPALTPPATIRLGAMRGRPAFIDVWASWCVPCREEAPLLARLWREHRRRIRFLGVDVEDTRGDARRFIRRYGIGYPQVFDRKAALAARLGFFGLPTAYLVDGEGRVAAKLVGRQKEATLRAGLAALAR